MAVKRKRVRVVDDVVSDHPPRRITHMEHLSHMDDMFRDDLHGYWVEYNLKHERGETFEHYMTYVTVLGK